MNKSVKEGWYNVPPINTERYGERAGLEGPFQTKAGKVVYYDPKEGAYYDPDSDIYLSYEEWAALNESVKYGVVYTTADDKIVPMLHKNYDTRDAAVKVAEAAVRTGSYKAYNIVEANVPGSPYNGMDRETRQIYQNLLYHGGGGSWTAQKAAQAEKNRGTLAASTDYSVYTDKDVKADGAAASAKYKEVVALFNKEKAAGTTGRKLMALKKASSELSSFPRYVENQAYDMNGYGAIFTGKKPWEELSDMAKAGVVRKQAQIKKKKAAINDLLAKLGLEPVSFVGSETTVEGKLPAHLAKFVDDKGDFTPEVKKRLGKDGEERLLGKKKPVEESSDEKTKNKTLGPKNKEAAVYEAPKKKGSKMNESYQDEMKKIMGAIDTARAAMPALQAEGDMRKVAALKAEVEDLIYAVNKGGNTDMHIAKIHELLSGDVSEAAPMADYHYSQMGYRAPERKPSMATDVKPGTRMAAILNDLKENGDWMTLSELVALSGNAEVTPGWKVEVSRTSIVEPLKALIKRGFVERSTRGNKNIFKAVDKSVNNVTESDDADRIARHSENLKDARAELRSATTASEKAHLKAEIAKYQARIDKIKKTPIEEAKATYNKDAVDKEIKKDKRIGGKEAKAIHGLLKGRTAEKKTVKEDIALDAAGMEQDHEVQMARGQLYHAARDAIRLHQMLKTVSEDNGIEAWVQSKITTAAEYLKTVADYMEYELINDGIDSTVGIAADQVQMPIGETTAGGIAGVAMPLGTIQKRKRPVKK